MRNARVSVFATFFLLGSCTSGMSSTTSSSTSTTAVVARTTTLPDATTTAPSTTTLAGTEWVFGAVRSATPLPGYWAYWDREGYRAGPLLLNLDGERDIILLANSYLNALCDDIQVPDVVTDNACYVVAQVHSDQTVVHIRILSYGYAPGDTEADGQSLLAVTSQLMSSSDTAVVFSDGTLLPIAPDMSIDCAGVSRSADLAGHSAAGFYFVLDPGTGVVLEVICSYFIDGP